MMDISHAMRGSIVGGDGHRNESEEKRQSENALDEEDANQQSKWRNLKRKPDDDYVYSKKRRKQLKPIRIATNLDDMVKVPKQIIGLNNDLDNINDMSHAVPKETSSKRESSPNFSLDDVQSHIPLDGAPGGTSPAEKCLRDIDKLEMADINVPNLEAGPNFITNHNFIFPFPFQSVKSPGFWSEAKIFNQEAYCELCKKEFCNKYFLKTHKANKHGIYADCPGASTGKKLEGRTTENGRSAETECERAFCEVCNKRFCNKYFVRRHKTKTHGLIEEDTNPETDVKKFKEDFDVQDSPLNLIVKDEEDDEDEECSSENIEKLETMLLRLNPSDEGKKETSSDDYRDDRKCEYLSEANDSSNESKTELKNEDFLYGRSEHLKQTKPTSSYCEICNKELCNKYFMRTHMQRMHGIEIEHGTQIGGVVCNICNKELCSKYFLRVHKQNTHGIVGGNSLLAPSTSGKAPRPAPLNLTQVCYICSKRFRSPKWLQAHFLSDHRDEATTRAPIDDPDDDAEEEESVLKIPKSRGPDPPETVDVISKLFWENDSSSKSYNCSQCPFTTSVLAFLFVHERSHYVLTQDPGKSLESLLHDQSFWQRKFGQQISDCLDLSSGKSKFVSFDQNGS